MTALYNLQGVLSTADVPATLHNLWRILIAKVCAVSHAVYSF
jgi:hypothetical protein